MTLITKPAAKKKAVRELKNLRTSAQVRKLAFCHGCHAALRGRSR